MVALLKYRRLLQHQDVLLACDTSRHEHQSWGPNKWCRQAASQGASPGHCVEDFEDGEAATRCPHEFPSTEQWVWEETVVDVGQKVSSSTNEHLVDLLATASNSLKQLLRLPCRCYPSRAHGWENGTRPVCLRIDWQHEAASDSRSGQRPVGTVLRKRPAGLWTLPDVYPTWHHRVEALFAVSAIDERSSTGRWSSLCRGNSQPDPHPPSWILAPSIHPYTGWVRTARPRFWRINPSRARKVVGGLHIWITHKADHLVPSLCCSSENGGPVQHPTS